MTHYLAIDTSGDCLSLALNNEQESECREMHFPTSNNDTLEENIQALLLKARIDLQDLSGVLFTSGPGSFTGLRIALAAVQGICLGAKIPAWAFPSLEVAFEYLRQSSFPDIELVFRKSRRNEFYVGFLSAGGIFSTQCCTSEQFVSLCAARGNKKSEIVFLGESSIIGADEKIVEDQKLFTRIHARPGEPCAAGLLPLFQRMSTEEQENNALRCALDFSNFQPFYLTPISAKSILERELENVSKKAQKTAS
jgi:tRNA threonylcarbamoyladenosine biosynthesis protein TsaB